MLHNIEPDIFDNKYIPDTQAGDSDYILGYRNNEILVIADGSSFRLPKHAEIVLNGNPGLIYLFSLNENKCFMVDGEINIPHGEYKDIHSLRTSGNRSEAWLGSAGYHLWNCYNDNKFCGRCGSKTSHKDNERAVICNSCGHTVYPRISPAIIVAVTNGDNILLAKGKHYRGNFYSHVAGYTDIGETLEQAVVREVKEEVGIDVSDIKYFGSQPWPFSGSMMIAFTAAADINQPIIIQESEIEDAKWYHVDELPESPKNISIAGEMIEHFRSTRKNR